VNEAPVMVNIHWILLHLLLKFQKISTAQSYAFLEETKSVKKNKKMLTIVMA